MTAWSMTTLKTKNCQQHRTRVPKPKTDCKFEHDNPEHQMRRQRQTREPKQTMKTSSNMTPPETQNWRQHRAREPQPKIGVRPGHDNTETKHGRQVQTRELRPNMDDSFGLDNTRNQMWLSAASKRATTSKLTTTSGMTTPETHNNRRQFRTRERQPTIENKFEHDSTRNQTLTTISNKRAPTRNCRQTRA